MAVVTKRVTQLPNLTAAKVGKASVLNVHGVLRTALGTVAIANGDSATSTVEVARLPSHARLHRLSKILSAGVAGLTDVDLGVTGAPACLADGVTLAAAGDQPGLPAVGLGSLDVPLWQLAGMASDPQKELSLFLTLNTAATGAGIIGVDLIYITE